LLDRADLVLYVIDGLEGITAEDMDFLSRRKESSPLIPVLVLWNKADLALPPSSTGEEIPGQLLALSAKTGEGISGLTHSICELLTRKESAQNFADSEYTQVGPGTLRQKELINTALSAVEEALALTSAPDSSIEEFTPRTSHDFVPSDKVPSEQVPLDIIAPLFRSAVNALGEITGEVSTADILDTMFGKFCVGK